MAFDLIHELEALVDALDEAGVQHAICGGLALGLHGFPRATSFDVGGRKLSVVSRDGLATMKRIAARPQDLVDVAMLEGGSRDDNSE